jgi:hypothetical protein
MARGSRFVNKAYLEDDELLDAYNLYTMCVSYQVIQIEDGDKIYVRRYPTGYHTLPEPGSLMSQKHRLMEYFSHFMRSEREQFFK